MTTEGLDARDASVQIQLTPHGKATLRLSAILRVVETTDPENLTNRQGGGVRHIAVIDGRAWPCYTLVTAALGDNDNRKPHNEYVAFAMAALGIDTYERHVFDYHRKTLKRTEDEVTASANALRRARQHALGAAAAADGLYESEPAFTPEEVRKLKQMLAVYPD